MTKIVPLLSLFFSVIFSFSPAQAAPNKSDRRVVTPGAVEPKSDAKNPNVTKTAAATTAFVRVLHAVPSGPQVDVYAGSLKVASNRGFTGLTSYTPLKIGKSAIKVFGAGTTSPVITTDFFNFKAGKYYTVAIYGKKAPTLLSIDESKGKANIEKARVRIIHLAPGAPELLITAPSTRGKLGYARMASKPLKYGKLGSKLTVPKTTTLQIRTIDGKIIKETKDLNFEADKRYSAFIIGEIGGKDDNALDVLVKPAGK